MKRLVALCSVLFSVIFSASAHADAAKTWLSLNINQGVFYEDMTREAEVKLDVVNDGAQPLQFDWHRVRFFLNGREITNWGEREIGFEVPMAAVVLKPGASTTVSFHCGPHIEKIGSYTLSAEVNGAKTAPLKIRVVPWPIAVPDEVLLLREIRKKLPKGWQVYFDPSDRWICIEHDLVPSPGAYELVPTRSTMPQPPRFGGYSAAYEAALRNPANFKLRSGHGAAKYRPMFAYSVSTYLSPDERLRRKATNERLRAIMQDVARPIPRGGKGDWRPQTPEQQQLYAIYSQLGQSFFEIPEYYFRRIALDVAWPKIRPSMSASHEVQPAFPETEKATAEMGQLQETVAALLTRYEPE